MCSDRRQARRSFAARLLFFCLACICAGIFLFQGMDALRRRLPVTASIRHRDEPITARALPDTAGKMDINRASAEDLRQADGIGPALAQRICELREERGGFCFLEELRDVSGIGEKRFEALSALFYCPMPDD